MKTYSKLSGNNSSNQTEELISSLAPKLAAAQKTVDGYLANHAPPLDIKAAMNVIENILLRFHLVVREVSERYDNRTPFRMDDEYDVQDLLEGLLRLYFDDIRREVPTTIFAGSSTRIDFMLNREQIGIEAKRTRKGLEDREIGDQLIKDIPHYRTHPKCKILYFFVYDPEENIQNPQGIIDDLNAKGDKNSMEIKVFIVPRRCGKANL
jgi:hypothetical protein